MTSREIHAQAENARESGDFVTALNLTDKAFVSYIQDKDLLGAAEVLCSRFNVYKHLHAQTRSDVYTTLADHTTQIALEIANKSSDPQALALPFFSRAKFYQDFLSDWHQASDWYQKALKAISTNPPSNHNRSAVLIDFQVHASFALGMLGDESSLAKIEESAHQLAALDENQSTKDVWLSGAYMRLARLANHFNFTQQTVQYLDQADQIIQSNPTLVLRAQQLIDLRSTLVK